MTLKQQTLIIFSGVPGAGKTTLACELAKRISAVYIRIDSLETALKNSALNIIDGKDGGYQTGYAIASDNLGNGLSVVADSVNPVDFTRNAWQAVGEEHGCKIVELEIVCSDRDEHKRRVENRVPDLPNQQVPSWEKVLQREYHPWDRKVLIFDTAFHSREDSLEKLMNQLELS